MPVEESANLLIMFAGIGDAQFAHRYWPLLEKWAAYLLDKGLDPSNQLCSDDFMGHLAHNANLSVKAIVGLGAFAKLCTAEGKPELAEKYRAAAQQMAEQWLKLAADEGGWYRLAFDRPGSWSQKYNLIWDRVLGLKLFPPEVAQKEMAKYRQEVRPFGLALDPRKPWCLMDWITWTASLTGNRDDFDAILGPVYRYVNETPSRVPLSDWWDVNTGRAVGFRARPVVGSVFLPLLDPRLSPARRDGHGVDMGLTQ
jgi:hypothetical protein